MGSVNNEMNPWKTQQLGLGSLFGQGGQNPYEQILRPHQGGGGQNPLIQSGGQNPLIQNDGGRQQPPQGGWNQLPQGPPRQDIFGIRGMGEQIGGFGEQLGGFGEQMGGFGEQLGGYKDEFININDKLQGLEQGISSLTDKFGTQQQQQPQQNLGMNPFGSINPYTPFFGGLGAFMRRY